MNRIGRVLLMTSLGCITLELALMSRLGLCQVSATQAQETQEKAITISEKVGEIIDAEERERFQLFPGITGFKSAVFLELADGSRVVEFAYNEEGEEKTIRIPYSKSRMEIIADYVDRYEEVTASEESRQAFDEKWQTSIKMELADSKESRRALDSKRQGEKEQTKFIADSVAFQGELEIPDSASLQILVVRDGSTFIGRILEVGETEVLFETTIGKMPISVARIREIKKIPASSVKNGQYWFPSPGASRLFFAPTGRTLKTGECYLVSYYLRMPMLAVGVTDNITISGGMTLFPGCGFADQFFYFAPKAGFVTRERFAVSAGALVIRTPSWEPEGQYESGPTVGICYSAGTLGSTDRSVTAGAGLGFADLHLVDMPMIMLGGEHRLSRRISLVTENWLLPWMDIRFALVSCGVRIFGEKLCIDLAFIGLFGSLFGEFSYLAAVPYGDVMWKFR